MTTTITEPTEQPAPDDGRDARRREALADMAEHREAQVESIVRLADGESSSEAERDAFRSRLAYAGGMDGPLGEAAREAKRTVKGRRSREKWDNDRWLGSIWLSDTFRCGTGHRATRPGQGRIEVGVSGLDWNHGTPGVPSAASDSTVIIEATGPTGDDGEPRPSVTVRLLPGEALELAALLTRSTRKLEKRQG